MFISFVFFLLLLFVYIELNGFRFHVWQIRKGVSFRRAHTHSPAFINLLFAVCSYAVHVCFPPHFRSVINLFVLLVFVLSCVLIGFACHFKYIPKIFVCSICRKIKRFSMGKLETSENVQCVCVCVAMSLWCGYFFILHALAGVHFGCFIVLNSCSNRIEHFNFEII